MASGTAVTAALPRHPNPFPERNLPMRSLLLAGLVAFAVSPAFAAGSTPCEDTLKDLRAAEASANVDAATMTKVAELEAKGVERCNADDDQRANAFFTEAMALLGK